MPVDHLQGHVATLYLQPNPLEPPFTCLLASGGHTLVLAVRDRTTFEVLGSTLDDAAGEAFDKGARLLGLGYPGGAEIDRLAREGDPESFRFPVARVPGLDFSFSGLKTALLYAVRDLSDAELESRRADLAASYQRAIVTALVGRLRAAAERSGIGRVAVVGGVAANAELRAALPDACFAPLVALHRQRGDDRVRRAFRASSGVARLPCSRCVLVGVDLSSALAAVLAAGAARRRRRRRERRRIRPGPKGWQGLLGSRPLPELGGRWIVVLRAPSLADRVRGAGGRASELQMRVWTTAARDAQERAIARLAFRGVPVQPEQSYVRVLNGFAASLDPRLLPALERDPDVAGRVSRFGPRTRRRCPTTGRSSNGRLRAGQRSSAGDRASGVRRLRGHGRPARHRCRSRGIPSCRAGCCRGSTWSIRAATRPPSRIRRNRDDRSGTGPSSRA